MVQRFLPPLAAFLFFGVLVLGSAPGAGAAETPAYMALGDSLAFGVGAENPSVGGYVPLAAQTLRRSERYRARGLEMINLSAPGATSADLLLPGGQLDRALAEIEARRDEPGNDDDVEIISIDIGGNDLLALASSDSPCLSDTASEPCRQLIIDMLGNLQRNLTQVLSDIRQEAPNARVYVVNLYNPYSGTGDPRELIANVAVQQVNGVLSAVASDPDLEAHLVSVYDLFLGRGSQWVANDGIHPNNDGHRVIAEVLLASVEGRAVALPEDLAAVPTEAPADGGQLPAPRDDSDDGDVFVLAVAVAIAFIAGALLTATYFFARGRPHHGA